jgi:hypothetical protein
MNWKVKPAEPDDDKGEVMVAMMTRIANVPERSVPYETADCPRCGEKCYIDRNNIRLAAQIYEDRMIALCTLCGMQGHANKTMVPTWLKRKRLTPQQALEIVLSSVQQH